MRHLFTRTVSVEPYRGAGAYGPVFDPPVEVACWLSDVVELVRDVNGSETVSSAHLFADADADIPVESRVTVDGRTTTVITSQVAHSPAGPHHLEVRLR